MTRPDVLSIDTLQAYRIITKADIRSLQRGSAYYRAGRVQVASVGRNEARLLVSGSRPTPYNVVVRLANGRVYHECDCPVAEGLPSVICKHKVCALMVLHDHLRSEPPVSWDEVLTRALGVAARTGRSASREVLAFSLTGPLPRWALVPYGLPLPEEVDPDSLDLPAVHDLARRPEVTGRARALLSTGEAQRVMRMVSLPPEARGAATLCLMSSMDYYYGFDGSALLTGALPLLAGAPVYRGQDNQAFASPLTVSLTPARPELYLESVPEGLRLTARIVVEGRPVSSRRAVHLIAKQPPWLLVDDTLMPLEDQPGALELLLGTPTLEIPREEEDLFLEQYLASLMDRFPLRGDALEWVDAEETEPIPRLYLDEEGGVLRARLRFAYGEHELPPDRRQPESSLRRLPPSEAEAAAGPGEGAALRLVRIPRRPEAEKEWTSALPTASFGLKRGDEHGTFVLRAHVKHVDFLLRHVPRIAAAGFEVYGEEALTSARVNRSRPSFSLRVSSGLDWFDVQAVVSFGETTASLKEIRGALRRRERYVLLADGSIGELPEEWIQRYRHLFGLGEEVEGGLRLRSHHVTLLEGLLQEADEAKVDAEFEERRQRLRSFSGIQPQEVPQGFVGELRPYQKAGLDWLRFLHDFGFGGCLADDMGLGKTLQALAFLLALRESGHARAADLVVMPRSLLFNWEREAGRFTPGLRLLIHADQDRPSHIAQLDGYDLVLTTYGVLLRDIELLRQYNFHYVVLDESQAVKNPEALTSRAVRLLRADHRLALTGTPVENSALELWSLFAFLNPGLLGSLDYFRREFAAAIERRGDEESVQLLRRLVYPFILRRTKDQVAPELPPRSERLLFSDMEPEQRDLYNRTRDYYRSLLLGLVQELGLDKARMKVLEGLLRLRQISIHPRLMEARFQGGSAKLNQLLETLETLHAEGHKALVFSQFVQMLRLVRKALEARGIPYLYLDGKTVDRQARVDAFQNDETVPFFLISLKAGGVGLNLTAADYVIHIDPWWNPAVELQASDRTHRIGQDKPVFVYKLIARDSVEEKILQLQERKRELVDQLITTDTAFFKRLDVEDIEALFR